MTSSRVVKSPERPFIFQLPAMSERRAIIWSSPASNVQASIDEWGRIGTERTHQPTATDTSNAGCRKIDRAAFHAGAWLISQKISRHTRSAELGRMRQTAVSRPVAEREEAFYLQVPSVAGQRDAPYDAPLFCRPILAGPLQQPPLVVPQRRGSGHNVF
jgi:hypothetical protein